MDWNTTKKDKDSLKKLIKQRYGVDATDNGKFIQATINGKKYNWEIDSSGNPVRYAVNTDFKLGNNSYSIFNTDRKSISPQKATPLKQSNTLLTNTNNKNDTTGAGTTIKPTTKLNVQTLQQMQNNPKEAQAIANNSFGTGAGNTTQPSSGFNLVPQANASYGDSGQSKTDIQNEKYYNKKRQEAIENIQNFFYDTEGTKDKNQQKLIKDVKTALESGADVVEINDIITANGYRHQNWAQKGLDSVGGTLNKWGEGIRIESDDDDGILMSGLKFLGNIPGNALRLGGDLVETVSHPWETAKGIGELADTGGDYLNYWVTGDPLMDKSKATGEAVKEMVTDPGTYIENPIDVITSVTGAGNLLKGTKVGKLGKNASNLTKAGISNAMEKTKLTKGIKNVSKTAYDYVTPKAKNAYDYTVNYEKIPYEIGIKPNLINNIEDLNKKQVDVAGKIVNDKYIDNSGDATKSSESFNYFGNEKRYIKEEVKSENETVKDLKDALKDIEINKKTTYDDLIKNLKEKETNLLNKQIEIADNTPKWKLSDFDYKKPNGEMSNRFEDIIEDLQNHLNDIDQTPEVYDMYNVLEGFKNGDKISEQQLLEIKRVYNGTFKNKYMKYDEVDKVWELRNQTSKVGKNFENNQKFIDNVLEEKNIYSDTSIKELDNAIKNVKTYQNKFKQMRAKVRSELNKENSVGFFGSIISTVEKMIKNVAKITPFLKETGLSEKTLSATQLQKQLGKNIKKLYKLEKQIQNGGKNFIWVRNQLENIMDTISPYFDNKVIQGTTNVLKKSGKTLLKDKKGGIPLQIKEGIEDREFENKYMK